MKRKRKNSVKDYNIKMKQLTLCSSCFHITLPTLSNAILLGMNHLQLLSIESQTCKNLICEWMYGKK